MSLLPLAGGTEGEPEKKDTGRAMNMTPRKETRLPNFSFRVKGSLIKIEHAQHDRLGARKVMTVASASGR
jgi:hypothetical protein